MRGGYSIKFCMRLIVVISYDKYYSQFYHPFVNWCNNRLLPLIRHLFLIPNRINEFAYGAYGENLLEDNIDTIKKKKTNFS
jgi:hypothetical protein